MLRSVCSFKVLNKVVVLILRKGEVDRKSRIGDIWDRRTSKCQKLHILFVLVKSNRTLLSQGDILRSN